MVSRSRCLFTSGPRRCGRTTGTDGQHRVKCYVCRANILGLSTSTGPPRIRFCWSLMFSFKVLVTQHFHGLHLVLGFYSSVLHINILIFSVFSWIFEILMFDDFLDYWSCRIIKSIPVFTLCGTRSIFFRLLFRKG